MELHIRGRRAAVAAGSAGLGLALATHLAHAGVSVAICGRDRGRLDAALATLRAASDHAPNGGEFSGVLADVSTTDGARGFISEASETLGGLPEILVCNGGGPPPGTPTATSVEDYRAAFESNCLASIAMCAAVTTHMRETGWGRILGITSIGAREPIGFLAASSVARAALTSYLKMLSAELAPSGVTVNNLQPGLHRTDRVTNLAGDQSAALLDDIPAGTFGEADDFGAVGAFLCSEHARFVTGVGLHVDGGSFRGLQ